MAGIKITGPILEGTFSNSYSHDQIIVDNEICDPHCVIGNPRPSPLPGSGKTGKPEAKSVLEVSQCGPAKDYLGD